MRKHLLASALAVALIMSIGAGLHQRSEAVRLRAALEGVWLGSLGEAAEALDALTISMEKALVAPGGDYAAAQLADASRAAAQVHHHLGLLPLSHDALSAALAFAHRLSGETARMAAESSAADAAWLEKQWHTCVQLAGQLAVARQDMLRRGLSMVPGEAVFYAPAQAGLRPVEAVAGLAIASPAEAPSPTGQPPQAEITQAEALQTAAAFVGAERVLTVSPAPDVTGRLPAYGVAVQTDGALLNLEITRQGGRVLMMSPETAAFPVLLAEDACRRAAEEFLLSRGFGEAREVLRQVYDGLCVMTFAPLQQGVLLYPDLLVVQVRMDTAEVVGLEATRYWQHHRERTALSPGITAGEALAPLPQASAPPPLCLIPHEAGEALCYQVALEALDSRFLVFVCAHSGEVLAVRKLIDSDVGVTGA